MSEYIHSYRRNEHDHRLVQILSLRSLHSRHFSQTICLLNTDTKMTLENNLCSRPISVSVMHSHKISQ